MTARNLEIIPINLPPCHHHPVIWGRLRALVWGLHSSLLLLPPASNGHCCFRRCVSTLLTFFSWRPTFGLALFKCGHSCCGAGSSTCGQLRSLREPLKRTDDAQTPLPGVWVPWIDQLEQRLLWLLLKVSLRLLFLLFDITSILLSTNLIFNRK